jgi:hypothetical protein
MQNGRKCSVMGGIRHDRGMRKNRSRREKDTAKTAVMEVIIPFETL